MSDSPFIKVFYRILFVLLLSVALFSAIFFNVPTYKEMQKNKRELARQIRENEELQERASKLETNARRFKTDPVFVEKVARENGLTFPGEIVFKFEVPSED